MRRAARDDFDAQIRDLEERIRRQRSANGRLSGPTRDQGHHPGKDDEAANRRKKDPTAASYPGATRSFTSSVMPCSCGINQLKQHLPSVCRDTRADLIRPRFEPGVLDMAVECAATHRGAQAR
jgi:hypothetical protein